MAKHKLLLADDSVTIQKVVNLTFADEGIEVAAVGDGDAAMQKFVEFVPDLVMVDVNMPGIDGYRICEIIKRDEETQHIPVILLVGSFEPFDEDEARRVGADDFLTKPFQSIRQLVNKVSDLLNGKKTNVFGDEAAFVNSFDDTLEMPLPGKETTEDFGDAAMDDEMIQTDQIGSLPVNEAQKFASAAATDFDDADLNFETESSDEQRNETAPDDDEPPPRHENIYDFANEQELENEAKPAAESEINEAGAEYDFTEENQADEPEAAPENEVEETVVEEINSVLSDETKMPAASETKRAFKLDDFDLLELPQSKKSKNKSIGIPSTESVVADTETSAGILSPEEIDAIAGKVAEKLSDQVIKRIVREVFTQMTKKK